MSTVIPFLLTIALIMSGWFTIGRDVLGSFWTATDAWKDLLDRGEQRAHTGITGTFDACAAPGSELLITLKNQGDRALTQFSKWDLVFHIQENPGLRITYLTYTENASPGPNQWRIKGIYLKAADLTPEVAEPGVFNPGEEMIVRANLSPPYAANTYARATFATPNGVTATVNVKLANLCPYYFHAESTAIAAVNYHRLKTVPGDGPATTISAAFTAGQTGRVRPTSNNGKFVYPLAGFSQIPAATWNFTYRAKRDKADFGFVWFTNATDISLAVTGSWQDIDLSLYIPTGATGVMVEVVNDGGDGLSGIVRGKEDTRDYMSNPLFQETRSRTHRWQMVKVDSARRIQGFIEDTDVDFKLLGYTIGADPAYFATPPDITPTTTGAWTTINVSSQVAADASGVILLISSITNPDRKYAVREVGSTFSDTTLKLKGYGNTMYLVGVNAAKQFDAFIQDANVKIYLVGQTKGSVVYYTDDLAVADPVTQSWQELDADTYGVPSQANGLVFRVENPSAVKRRLSLRHGASTDDWNGDISDATHLQGAVGIRSDNVWDEFMENTTINVFIAAYTRLVRMDVHADVDVLVRLLDGTIGVPLGINVANTGNITGTTWQTFSATYAFPGYIVLSQTDYLEIDLFAEATANTSEESVSVDFRIDDPLLSRGNQTHVE